jgi:hypothetical protein
LYSKKGLPMETAAVHHTSLQGLAGHVGGLSIRACADRRGMPA